MQMYVDTEALNFRSEPRVDSDTRIGLLHLGQRVEDVKRVDDDWFRVRADVDSEQKSGFVSARYLRDPVEDAREGLVAAAVAEWIRFEKGLGKEYQEPFYKYVGEMWSAIQEHLDGRDRCEPWSAAAISFMIRKASGQFPAYNDFRYSAAHARFIHDAVIKRFDNDTSAPFWGFRLYEHRPKLGDIVCQWRKTRRDFDDAISLDHYKSHSDIIISIRNKSVFTIGGNVKHSVKIKKYDKTESGFIDDSRRTFAILANRVS